MFFNRSKRKTHQPASPQEARGLLVRKAHVQHKPICMLLTAKFEARVEHQCMLKNHIQPWEPKFHFCSFTDLCWFLPVNILTVTSTAPTSRRIQAFFHKEEGPNQKLHWYPEKNDCTIEEAHWFKQHHSWLPRFKIQMCYTAKCKFTAERIYFLPWDFCHSTDNWRVL